VEHLRREYTLANFCDALSFTSRVGDLAEPAGHHPAMVVQGDTVTHLTERSYPIGVVQKCEYVEQRATLAPGDRLYQFSDGLFEQPTPTGKQLGLDAIRAIITEQSQEAQHVLEATIADARAATQTSHFDDDVSLLEVRVDGRSSVAHFAGSMSLG